MLVTHKTTRKIGAWDLADLFKDPNSEEFEEFVKAIEEKVRNIENKRKNLSNDMAELNF